MLDEYSHPENMGQPQPAIRDDKAISIEEGYPCF